MNFKRALVSILLLSVLLSIKCTLDHSFTRGANLGHQDVDVISNQVATVSERQIDIEPFVAVSTGIVAHAQAKLGRGRRLCDKDHSNYNYVHRPRNIWGRRGL